MATNQKSTEPTELQGSISRRTREEGISKILAPSIAAEEGARLNIFGRTRSGKSAFARELLRSMIRSTVAMSAVVHDIKYPDRQQYDGPTASNETELQAALEMSPVAVCRPPFSAAQAAAVTRDLVTLCGEPTVLLIDETRRALGLSQRWIDNECPKNFEWILLEGGGLRASLVLLVQVPRQLPGDAIDSAQFSVVFGLGGRSLAYLLKAGTVPDEAASTVRRLKPGEFCVFSDDDDWDQTIYYSPLSVG